MKVIACQSLLLLALLITSEALYIRKGIESSPLDALRRVIESSIYTSYAKNFFLW
jgi:hypothetical protein